MERQVVPFNHDPFLRDSMHRETLEKLEKGHHYYPAMVLVRSASGALHPASIDEIGSNTMFFMPVAEANLVDAPEDVNLPVLISGSVMASTIRLPDGATLTTRAAGKMVFDQLVGSRIIPVAHDFVLYHAGQTPDATPEPEGDA